MNLKYLISNYVNIRIASKGTAVKKNNEKVINRLFHNQSWEVISSKNVNNALVLFPMIVELWTF
jgi:hypothetical protein